VARVVGAPWHTGEVLDFAQAVIGPCVQLEALGITGFPPRPGLAAERRGRLIQTNGGQGWHRDGGLSERYASEEYHGGYWGAAWARSHYHPVPPLVHFVPESLRNPVPRFLRRPRRRASGAAPGYAPPAVGCNLLLYLQDMTDETGRLHVVPGSHAGLPRTPQDDDRWVFEVEGGKPTEALAARAGDLVVTHDEVLHSGGFNTSGGLRAYMSTKVCRLGLPHRDDFSAPAVRRMVAEARARGDARCLRFFGEPARPAVGGGAVECLRRLFLLYREPPMQYTGEEGTS
jgi:hypothetical protein